MVNFKRDSSYFGAVGLQNASRKATELCIGRGGECVRNCCHSNKTPFHSRKVIQIRVRYGDRVLVFWELSWSLCALVKIMCKWPRWKTTAIFRGKNPAPNVGIPAPALEAGEFANGDGDEPLKG